MADNDQLRDKIGKMLDARFVAERANTKQQLEAEREHIRKLVREAIEASEKRLKQAILDSLEDTTKVVGDLIHEGYTLHEERIKKLEERVDLVRQLGLSGAVSYFEDFTKRHIQALVQKRIWHEVKAPVEEQLTRIGDTTLAIEEVVQLWEDSEDVLTNAEELLFGNTPVKELLAEAAERFRRE